MCKLFKKKGEDKMGILEALLILLIGGILGYTVWRKAESNSQKRLGEKPSKDKATRNISDKKITIKEETQKWFEKKYKEWYQSFLSYYLEEVATEKSIPVTKLSKFNEFLKKRGLKKAFIKPSVGAFLDYTGEKNKAIKEFLQKQNFPINHPDEPRKDLEEFIKQKARKEAEKIVEEFLRQEGENDQ
ncbi:hypothetical protein Theam_0925 [Thermovibrio ammonificans HB-1]|uniref:Uncharacterized protein n=1 Tax=Thermovibrio ammonificans (strain DSM 15698 / JCM 12110 / HB-1) TaxID=648996 RepID=E8T1Z7_THEA1|nr:hypothetical protein [Thermovibrio ammonificans]ADU96892.1 hypothetical protein Theam_0925 [Thermovibrio ammonificans HB-1]